MKKEEAEQIVDSEMMTWEFLQRILDEADDEMLDDFCETRKGWTKRHLWNVCRRYVEGKSGTIRPWRSVRPKGARAAIRMLIEFGNGREK